MNPNKFRIEIMGCMASGKTTLCKTMQKMGWDVRYELYENNPFLAEFHQNSNNAFENQMWFLLQHYSAMKQYDALNCKMICDYSLFLDSLYASILLSDEEFEIHSKLRSYITEKTGNPDCIIKLVAPEEVIYQRIIHRGRTFEQNIDVVFVQKLMAEIKNFSKHSNILTIDSSKINLMDENDVYSGIIKKI